MKERSIIFNAEMVRAILDGRKTQTRRLLKLQPCGISDATFLENLKKTDYQCPFGKFGDRLWVRETCHMPRWASRITLDIVGVRAERLHDIDEIDAEAEGAFVDSLHDLKSIDPYKRHFVLLWESLYGKKYSWTDNPWVWVIEFRLTPGE